MLSTETGALRDYGSDPYGSYVPESGYYVSDQLYFPVRTTNDRFPNKDIVIGVRVGDRQLAIHKELVRRKEKVSARIGGTRVTARWDERLATARVFSGEGDDLADFLDSMWFAWYAFYPTTEILS